MQPSQVDPYFICLSIGISRNYYLVSKAGTFAGAKKE